ncbi:MAG: hypothetical protein JOY54_06445 [Acidobacteriaceae bacterium]|nr:hypothetical protein [Acidobacteriaceae bacterium]
MPRIRLCFLWHMHQPFYKDLVSGEYRLPWARLHALKDYFGMVKILEDFPEIRQTFNLVPSLVMQIEDYATGQASDPFLRLALKPADELSENDKEFVLRYFFQANEQHHINRYPRYAELFRVMKETEHNPARAMPRFDAQMLRDLQVLSQLAWFDEEYLRKDPDIRALAEKGRDYNLDDQALLGSKQKQAMRNVLAVYKEFADRDQIELSASALYHPILPLVCDSNIAYVSHPYIALPSQFAYPADAEEQVKRARLFFKEKFGVAPAGFWPSEGSVSDETLRIAARAGFKWMASDDAVLARTIHPDAAPEEVKWAQPDEMYRPYRWRQDPDEISILFRDHILSDLIGFIYSRMELDQAVDHFLTYVRENCATILGAGKDAVVPIILDGENAWENYAENGRPFLTELYKRISEDPKLIAVTISEALNAMPPRPLARVFPGSWIDANFDLWIGAEEDNCAWDVLLQARRKYDEVLSSAKASALPKADKQTAWEELMIAEGSDWCWWYGPEHWSVNRSDFDQLYRDHLANVYRLLQEEVPAELGQPLFKQAQTVLNEPPSALIQPIVDGKLSFRQEWQGAGRYKIDVRSGAMHSRRPLAHELHYGSDGQSIFFRLDVADRTASAAGFEFRLKIRNSADESFHLDISAEAPDSLKIDSNLPEGAASAAMEDICELRISMSALHVRPGDPIFVSLAVYHNGLPVAALPPTGELHLQCSPMMMTFAF